MSPILTSVLVLVAVFLVLFGRRIVALLLLRSAARTALSDIGQQALMKQPDTITLSRLSDPGWKDAAAIDALAQPLLTAGFSDLGVYSIDKMPGVKVRMLFQDDTAVAAHLCEHPKAGVWPELVTRYDGGSSHSISALPATGIELPPWVKIIRLPGTPTGELYQRLLRERSSVAIKRITRGDVVREFEEGYLRQMIWMKNKGISPEEVAAVVKKWAEKKIV